MTPKTSSTVFSAEDALTDIEPIQSDIKTLNGTLVWLIVLLMVLGVIVVVINTPLFSNNKEELHPESAAAAICKGLGYEDNARVTVTHKWPGGESEYEMSCGEARQGLKAFQSEYR